MHYFIDIVVITVAVFIAEIFIEIYHRVKNRNMADLFCDACEQPKKTSRTPNKKRWLCKDCMAVYKEEYE